MEGENIQMKIIYLCGLKKLSLSAGVITIIDH